MTLKDMKTMLWVDQKLEKNIENLLIWVSKMSFVLKTKQEYTFWDYFAGSWQKNYGMRIDHFLLSNSLIENIKSININKKPRSKEKPSDHTPIELEII